MPDGDSNKDVKSSTPPRRARSDEGSTKSIASTLSTPTRSTSGGWAVCLPASGSQSEKDIKTSELRFSPTMGGSDFELDLPASFVEMVRSQFVRYGDYIKLFTKSHYAKSNKHGTSGFVLGSSTDGGYVGVYEKPDGTTRVAVPPIGENCPGTFSESVFQIQVPENPEARIGEDVKYGDVVVLVDALGMVWNNKVGGFFDGYLGPNTRGIPGEVFISFRKNGKDGKELLYGDPGVYIDVEESHRHRTTYNNRLTNYKTSTSKFAGGYVSSDGTGKELNFSIHPKSGTPEAAYDQNSFAYGNRSMLLRKMSSRTLRSKIPDIRCVKVVRQSANGRALNDVVVLDPVYDKPFKVYNVGKEDKVVVVLYDNSEATVEANNIIERIKRVSMDCQNESDDNDADYLMIDLQIGEHEDPFFKKYGHRKDKRTENEHGLTSLQVFFEPIPDSHEHHNADHPKQEIKTKGADIWDVLFSFDKLAIAYVAIAFILPYVLSLLAVYLDSHKEIMNAGNFPVFGVAVQKLSTKFIERFAYTVNDNDTSLGSVVIPRRMGDVTGASSIIWAVFSCWVLGLITPPFVRMVEQPSEHGDDKKERETKMELLVRVSATHSCFNVDDEGNEEKEADDESQSEDNKAYMCEWRKAGVDGNGIPRHPAFQRFLIGENNVMDVALKRWEVTCSWRESKRVDEILEQPHVNFEIIQKAYPSCLLGRSKKGYPVYIERPGEIDMQMLRDANITLEDLLWHYVYFNEFTWQVVEPQEGNPTGRFVTILDLKGVKLFDLVGDAIAFLKNAVSISQDHYPERGAKIFIINAPFFFKRAFALVKPFMAEATLEKMEVHAKNFRQALLKDIDADILPQRYGGNYEGPDDNVPYEQLLRYKVGKQLLKTGAVLTGKDGELDNHSTDALKRFVAEYEKEQAKTLTEYSQETIDAETVDADES